MKIKYENDQLEELKNNISEFHDREIETAMRDIVNEIYQEKSSKSSVLNYNEWKDWIQDQRGVRDIVQFK